MKTADQIKKEIAEKEVARDLEFQKLFDNRSYNKTLGMVTSHYSLPCCREASFTVDYIKHCLNKEVFGSFSLGNRKVGGEPVLDCMLAEFEYELNKLGFFTDIKEGYFPKSNGRPRLLDHLFVYLDEPEKRVEPEKPLVEKKSWWQRIFG